MSDSKRASKAVIVVGGKLGDFALQFLNSGIPNCLLKVVNSPICLYHIRALRKVPGLKEIYLLGSYDENLFDDFIREVNQVPGEVCAKYFKEDDMSFPKMRSLLGQDWDDVFILDGNTCSTFPLDQMYNQHVVLSSKFTSMVTTVQYELTEACMKFSVEEDTMLATRIVTNETIIPDLDLISCKVYLYNKFSSANLTDAIAAVGANLGIKSDEMYDSHVQYFQKLVEEKELCLYICSREDFFIPIRNPQSLLYANKYYLSHKNYSQPPSNNKYRVIPPVYIHPSAKIGEFSKMGPNVTIGPDVTIETGVLINNSIIYDKSHISKAGGVINTILFPGSRIGAWARAEGIFECSPDMNLTTIGFKNKAPTVMGENSVINKEIIVYNCVIFPEAEVRSSQKNEIIV